MAEQVRMLQSSVTVLLNFFVTIHQDDHLVQFADRHGRRALIYPQNSIPSGWTP